MARKKAKSEAKSEAPKKIKPISLNILEIAKRIQKLEQTSGGGDHSALANKSDIATDFNTTTAYTAGCFVYHDGKLYQFNADHAAGAWDPTDVVVANITDQVVSNKAAIDGLTASDVSYDNTTSGLSATKVQGAVDELAESYPASKVMMSDGVTSVEDALSYSETEHVVGKWIDGSTIYEKTIDFGALPNNTRKTVNHNIANLGTIVDAKGWGIDTTNAQYYPIPFVTTTDLTNNIQMFVDTTKITIDTGANRTSINGYITLRYIKNS